MLTVKHIDEDGHEIVIPADRATYHPPGMDGYGLVRVYRGDEVSAIATGWVYVMNANGKTVANYDLRPVKAAA